VAPAGSVSLKGGPIFTPLPIEMRRRPAGEVGEVPAVGADRVRRASLLPALDQRLGVERARREACSLEEDKLGHRMPTDAPGQISLTVLTRGFWAMRRRRSADGKAADLVVMLMAVSCCANNHFLIGPDQRAVPEALDRAGRLCALPLSGFRKPNTGRT